MQIFHRLRRLAAVLLLVPLCAGVQPVTAAQRTQAANVVNVVPFAAPPVDIQTTPPQSARGDLLLASDDNIYFTSSQGGVGYGTIGRLAADGTVSVVYAFATGDDGYSPFAGLMQAADGNLYGTTYYGGKDRQGSIFKLTLDGQFTSLHVFTTDKHDAKDPYTGLVQAGDGNLYGTTLHGGDDDKGTIYRIGTDGTDSTFAIIHKFEGGADDGKIPEGQLIVGSDGQLYGTTMQGGPDDRGVIYRISAAGDFEVLYSFSSLSAYNATGQAINATGANPRAGLLLAADGNYYGTTYQGGGKGYGTLYRMTVSGDSVALSTVHDFAGFAFDGGFPTSSVSEDADGNLYGTTSEGGYSNKGAAWKVAPDGTATMLHGFTGSLTDGATPYAGLLVAHGSLYGVTTTDQVGAAGSIFKLEQGSGGVLPVDLTISATTITTGDSVQISWNAPDAANCYKFGSWSDLIDDTGADIAVANSGSEAVAPGAGIYAYGLACTDTAGVTHNALAGLVVNAPLQETVDGGKIVGGGALSWLLLALLAALLFVKLIKETRSSCP